LNPYAAAWFRAFALTVVIELVVAVPLLAPSGAGRARRAAIVVLANLASHPLVWFGFPQWGLVGTERLVCAELFAVAVETAAYLLTLPVLGPQRAFATSALSNGTSLAAGLLFRALGAPL